MRTQAPSPVAGCTLPARGVGGDLAVVSSHLSTCTLYQPGHALLGFHSHSVRLSVRLRAAPARKPATAALPRGATGAKRTCGRVVVRHAGNGRQALRAVANEPACMAARQGPR
jgi:hypothetical protein